MKKRRLILVAITLFYSAILLTSCNDETNFVIDNTRVYRAVWHDFACGGDFLDYFNVDITLDNSCDKSGQITSSLITKRIEKKDLDSNGNYEICQIIKLPGKHNVIQKVTLKDDVDYSKITSMRIVTGHDYKFGFLNSKGKLIDNKIYNGAGAKMIVNAFDAELVQCVVRSVENGYYDIKIDKETYYEDDEWVSLY